MGKFNWGLSSKKDSSRNVSNITASQLEEMIKNLDLTVRSFYEEVTGELERTVKDISTVVKDLRKEIERLEFAIKNNYTWHEYQVTEDYRKDHPSEEE